MLFLLDSADLEAARTCATWGWVKGVTTNPLILVNSTKPAQNTLEDLKKIIRGPIFYQLTSQSTMKMIDEAKHAHDILKKQLVLKIPATTTGFEACSNLSDQYTCAITSVFSPAQALVANAAGAKYALYYHNRAKRLLKNGKDLPEQLVNILRGSETSVIAASLKTREEIMEARNAGVEIMTTTFDVLKQLTEHDLSNQALHKFNEDGIGLII
jgi:transaldolase